MLPIFRSVSPFAPVPLGRIQVARAVLLQVYADARLQVNYAVGAQVLLADNGELLANIRLCWRKANAAMKVAQFALPTTRREPAWGALGLSLSALACWQQARITSG